MAKKDIFFVNIPNPKDVRRNILESSQQMVEGMKSYEKYKKIKGKKLQKLDNLKKTTASIKELAGQLRGCLPTVKTAPDVKRKKDIPHVAEIELEQLNNEIRKLEEELHML
jgi:protein subunit release factor A